MRRKQITRTVVAAAGLVALAMLVGCKPDIPLIPFIKGQQMDPTPTVRPDSVGAVPVLAKGPEVPDYAQPSSN